MSIKQLIAVAVLMISVILNALLLNERLEKRFYQKGVDDGAKQLGEKLVSEVQKNQAINVKMPDGKQVTLATLEAFQKQIAARQTPVQPPGGREVIPSKQETPIDALKGSIDQPKE